MSDATPSLSREQRDTLHRARIAEALIAVVAQRGYAAATVADVAAHAVMSRRTFYRLYDNKADAFADAFHLLGSRAMRRMRRAAQEYGDPVARVHAAMAAVLELIDEHPSWGRVFLSEGPPLDGSGGPGDRHLIAFRTWCRAASEYLPKDGDMAPEERVAAVIGILRTRLAEGTRPTRDLLPAVGLLLTGQACQAPPPPDGKGSDCPAEPLGWESLLQAVVERDDDALAELQRRAMAEPPDDGYRPVELQAMADVAAVARRGGVEAVLIFAGRGGPATEVELSRQAWRCLRYVAANPGTSGRGVMTGMGLRSESQISRLLADLASRGLVEGSESRTPARSWCVTDRGRDVLEQQFGVA